MPCQSVLLPCRLVVEVVVVRRVQVVVEVLRVLVVVVGRQEQVVVEVLRVLVVVVVRQERRETWDHEVKPVKELVVRGERRERRETWVFVVLLMWGVQEEELRWKSRQRREQRNEGQQEWIRQGRVFHLRKWRSSHQ